MWVKLLMDALKVKSAPAGDDASSLMGVLRSVTAIRHTLDSQAGLYAQLIQLELEHEQRRITRLCVLFGLVLMGLGGFLLFSGVLLLALVWETEYRNWVLGGVALGYGLLMLVALVKVRGIKSEFGAPFASVRAELKADLAVIKSQI